MVYLGLGWVGVISGVALWRRHGFSFMSPLLVGGLAYTIGAIFEYLRRPVLIEGVVGPHELFHVAVVLGIAFHWRFIYHSPELEGSVTTSGVGKPVSLKKIAVPFVLEDPDPARMLLGPRDEGISANIKTQQPTRPVPGIVHADARPSDD